MYCVLTDFFLFPVSPLPFLTIKKNIDSLLEKFKGEKPFCPFWFFLRTKEGENEEKCIKYLSFSTGVVVLFPSLTLGSRTETSVSEEGVRVALGPFSTVTEGSPLVTGSHLR